MGLKWTDSASASSEQEVLDPSTKVGKTLTPQLQMDLWQDIHEFGPSIAN